MSRWTDLGPTEIRLRGREELDRLIALTNDEAVLLEPRIARLEETTGPAIFERRGYSLSKQRTKMDFSIEPFVAPRAKADAAAGMAPAYRSRAADRSTPPPDQSARTGTLALLVGQIRDRGPLTDILRPHDGERIALRPDAQLGLEGRLSQEGLASWLSLTDDGTCAAVDLILLGSDAGRAEVEALQGKVAAHARVCTEQGSSAATWIAAAWDGGLHLEDGVLVASRPGPQFRLTAEKIETLAAHAWPKISVVTISFNQAAYLERCLQSVLTQDYPNLEYIVIDGGSTDGSIEILERYRARLAHLVVEPDEGQSDALNKGFARATGTILTWINSDDCLAPLSLRKAAMAFERFGTDIVAGTCERIDVDDAVFGRHFSAFPANRPVRFEPEGPLCWSQRWEKGHYFFQPEVFFSRDIWERAGAHFHLHHYWAMDWDLWLRFACAGATIVRIPDILGQSRMHPEQKTTSQEFYLPQLANILRDFNTVFRAIAGRWDHAPTS